MTLKPNHQICPKCNGIGFRSAIARGEFRTKCDRCDATGQIPITLKPGIYGQVGVPPIVMGVYDLPGPTTYESGPFYLLAYSTKRCIVWDKKSDFRVEWFSSCRLTTLEECQGIEPWRKD